MSVHLNKAIEGFVSHAKIQKSGNSAAVLVPAAVMRALGFQVGGSVRVSVQSGAMVIEGTAPKYSLATLCEEHLKGAGNKREYQAAMKAWLDTPLKGNEVL